MHGFSGTASGRISKSFSFLETGGRLCAPNLRSFVEVYQGVALYVVTDVIARNVEVLGPKPITKDERNAAAAFAKAMSGLAKERLQIAGTKMFDQARARSPADAADGARNNM